MGKEEHLLSLTLAAFISKAKTVHVATPVSTAGLWAAGLSFRRHIILEADRPKAVNMLSVSSPELSGGSFP